MFAFAKILQALGALLPAIFDWWQRTQATKAQEDAKKQAQDSANSINANPGSEWMQRFNPAGNPNSSTTTSTASTASPAKPDSE